MSNNQQFYAGLNGLRLFSAYAVICTHISYQTGHIQNTISNYLFGRLDIAVAVFFSLSGFLLWRKPAMATYSSAQRTSDLYTIINYYVHRCARILPSYWVVVAVVLCTLPSQLHTTWKIRLANIFLCQNYVQYGLIEGLTQMWSLDVEVVFYLLLPLIWVMMSHMRRYRYRQWILIGSFFCSLAWWALPIHAPKGTLDVHSLLPGYWCWFVPGIMLAEYDSYCKISSENEHDQRNFFSNNLLRHWLAKKRLSARKLLSSRLIMYSISIVSYFLIASPLGGPLGLHDPTVPQRIIRMALGAVVAGTLLAPQIFSPIQPKTIFSLSHPYFAYGGYWAYGIFLWHLYSVSAVFSLLQIFYFQGHFIKITFFSILISTALGAINYILIENPCFTKIISLYQRSHCYYFLVRKKNKERQVIKEPLQYN